MELEVSIGQKEQTDVQHNIFMEMNSLLEEPFNLSSQGKKEKTTTDDEVEEAIRSSEEIYLSNLSTQLKKLFMVIQRSLNFVL